jgi:hypothetical protein
MVVTTVVAIAAATSGLPDLRNHDLALLVRDIY